MSKDLALALTTTLNDRLSGPLQRMLQDTQQRFDQLAKSLAGTGQVSDDASRKVDRLASSTAALGRIDASKKLRGDFVELARDAERAVQSTSRLSAALGKLPMLARGATSAFAGLSAAKFVLANPMRRAMDYELELARASNIAYDERKTVKGRQEGQRELDAAVRRATLQGVSREDALSGLKTLISAGANRGDAMTMLPTLAKFSMAGDASMVDVASVALKAQQNFRIDPSQMPQALQMALTAGKLGQFEFKDMAKWLPEQMSIAKNMLGMQGLGDLSTLLAANQFAAKAAGNNNAAGNNLVNFLGKINSTDTQNDAKKLGIDLTGTLAKARGNGMSAVDGFLALVKRTAEQDPEYAKLQGRFTAAQAKGDKRGETVTLEAMRDLMMGRSLGRLVQDRQALLGMLGLVNDPKGFAAMRTDIQKMNGGVDIDQATLMATASMKMQQGENAQLARQYDALHGLNTAMGDSQQRLAQLSAEYPKAAAGVEMLKLAAEAAAAMWMAMGAARLVTGIAGAGGVGAGLAAAGGAMAGALPSILGVGLAGLTGAAVGTVAYQKLLAGNSGGDAVGETVARLLAFFGNNEAKQSLDVRQRADAALSAGTDTTGRANGAESANVVGAIRELGNRPVKVEVFLDGRRLAEEVNQYNALFTRRN